MNKTSRAGMASRFLNSIPQNHLSLLNSSSSFNRLIQFLTNSSSPHKALAVFSQMQRTGLAPDRHTYPFVLKSCALSYALNFGKQAHSDCFKRGLASIVYIQNALMLLYSKCGHIAVVRKMFDEMPLRTLASWNTVISAYINHFLPCEAISMFRQMRISALDPDLTTFVVLLSATAELGRLRLGKWVHAQVVAKRFDINVRLGTALINMYAKCGELVFAKRVFDTMRVRNVWTWSAMIAGFAQHGSAREALDLFVRMKRSSVQPNHVTFLGVLSACSHAGLVSQGNKLFEEMVHGHGIKPLMTHYSAMVDLLGRKGHLIEAYSFVTQMPVAGDAVVWRTMLSSCQLHRDKDVEGIGERVRRRLLEMEPQRSGNYVMVANMFSGSGSWADTAMVRRRMKEEGLKKPAAESCIEVDGSVHRFVSGDDSCRDRRRCVFQLLDGLSLHMKRVGFEADRSLLQDWPWA